MIEVFSSFDLLILSLTLRSEKLPSFRQVSVLHFKALFECNGKFWSLSKRLFGAHQHPNEESNVWCSVTVQLSQLKSRFFQERNMTSFSPISRFANESRYFSCAHHLERIVGWLPCFSCLAFLSVCFAFKNITCLLETPYFGPRLEFFFMTKRGIETKSQFVFWSVVGLREYFRFLPQLQ